MVVDAVCLSEEQQKLLNELLTACRLTVKAKQIKMPGTEEPAIGFCIDKIAGVLKKIDAA